MYKILIKNPKKAEYTFYTVSTEDPETGEIVITEYETEDLEELETTYKELLETNLGGNLKAVQDLVVSTDVDIQDN